MPNLEPGSITRIESLEAWDQAFEEIKGYKICGLDIVTTGPDPLTSGIRLAQLALPNGQVYIADFLDLGEKALDDLAALMEDDLIKKVIHNANFELSFIRASRKRRLKFKNIFDILLASQLCWSGYYDLMPSKSPKNPWKKRVPDHSLEALAERHLGLRLEKSCQVSDGGTMDLAPEQIYYSVKRAQLLLTLHAIFQGLIEKNGLEEVAELEFRTISPVVEMELSGVCFESDAASASSCSIISWILFLSSSGMTRPR